MARTISRATKMDKTIVLRATEDDRIAVKLAAQRQGAENTSSACFESSDLVYSIRSFSRYRLQTRNHLVT